MEAIKKELMPNVTLTSLRTDKFKTGCSRQSADAVTAENASKNAVIPRVLRRGTTRHPDMESISGELNELYGARIEPAVRKKGEIQVIGFFSDFADGRFVPAGEMVLERVANLNRRDVFISEYPRRPFSAPVCGQRVGQLIEQIQGTRQREEGAIPSAALLNSMCPGENYATDKWAPRTRPSRSIIKN